MYPDQPARPAKSESPGSDWPGSLVQRTSHPAGDGEAAAGHNAHILAVGHDDAVDHRIAGDGEDRAARKLNDDTTGTVKPSTV